MFLAELHVCPTSVVYFLVAFIPKISLVQCHDPALLKTLVFYLYVHGGNLGSDIGFLKATWVVSGHPS